MDDDLLAVIINCVNKYLALGDQKIAGEVEYLSRSRVIVECEG